MTRKQVEKAIKKFLLKKEGVEREEIIDFIGIPANSLVDISVVAVILDRMENDGQIKKVTKYFLTEEK